ncbi:hypothetical protein Y032_0134g1857 [Ancylostoma ceylanicum]|uniref:Uncharacterized protein n=1 Tax=Ancylostoma ceylanicum TaxID=53326 RepID=A0A016T577_9BILA|nr:hypothetical protein Y032_0134g1857 [Ancylostoma ceylanicum]
MKVLKVYCDVDEEVAYLSINHEQLCGVERSHFFVPTQYFTLRSRFISACFVGKAYRERHSRLPLPRLQHPRGEGEPSPNNHSARPRRVDVAAAGVTLVSDFPCMCGVLTF